MRRNRSCLACAFLCLTNAEAVRAHIGFGGEGSKDATTGTLGDPKYTLPDQNSTVKETSCARRLGGAQKRGMRGLSVELRLSPPAKVYAVGALTAKINRCMWGGETIRKRIDKRRDEKAQHQQTVAETARTPDARGTRMTLTGRCRVARPVTSSKYRQTRVIPGRRCCCMAGFTWM